MKTHITQLSLSEVDEKNKMMVVRVSLDLYNLLQREAELLEITVSALVRSLFSFNYYPDLVEISMKQARSSLAERVDQAQQLDGGLSEYETRLQELSEGLELCGVALGEELERVSKARDEITGVLRTLALEEDDGHSKPR